MLKVNLSGALRAVRRMALMLGLAMTLALMLGGATTALAAVPGDPFKLGRVNTINALTSLVGSVNNAMIKVDNNSTGTSATALDLQVEPGKAPMKVNSQTKVANLNADSLDGKDSGELSSAYFFGTESHAELGSSGGGVKEVATLSDLPAGQYLVNAHVAAVNFHELDFFRCGLRVEGKIYPGSTTTVGSENPVSQISAAAAVSLPNSADVTLICGHDRNLAQSPYVESIRLYADRTSELQIQPAG
jgi:hypothetical protein